MAKHHGLPFYVAAPLTSVDLAISSGDAIVIEERSPKELLNARGGLGERVAAPGISVWNPAFDVTPATFISGIITEKVCPPPFTHNTDSNFKVSKNVCNADTTHKWQGVITKAGGADSFDIRSFVKNVPKST